LAILFATVWALAVSFAAAEDNPAALSDAEKEAFLAKGTIVATKAIDHGVTKPQRATLSNGKLKHDAQIQVVNRELPPFIRDNQGFPSFDRWRYNVAAYRVDRLVQLNMVPVSVARKHGTAPASFTWWVDDVAMDEVHLTTPVSAEAIAGLKLGDVVYVSGVVYTAREGVYHQVVDKGVPLPAGLHELSNVNFQCAPAARARPDGSYHVEAVTATASFRFGRSMSAWFERSGARVIIGKAGLTELAYREWFVPHGAVYLTTVGYGMGAAYGHCITRVRDVYWLRELGIAQALWVLEVDKIGPFLVEGDAEGRSLFALANREIDARIDEIYRDLPPPALSRFGEVLSRKGEVI
jgi:L(+)-tartrate dehydratase beta subunit